MAASRTPTIILAGGAARRMGGGDKPLRPLGGRPMLDHVLDRMRPQATPLALSANGDPARFAAYGLRVLPDGSADRPGPLAGVLAGLAWGRELGAAWLVSVPGDAPFLPVDLVARLQAARLETRAPVVCAASGGRTHPVAALWSAGLERPLRDALARGEHRVGAFVDAHRPAIVPWFRSPDPFFNVNTPEDLVAAAAWL